MQQPSSKPRSTNSKGESSSARPRMQQTGHHGRKTGKSAKNRLGMWSKCRVPASSSKTEAPGKWVFDMNLQQSAHMQRTLIRLVCYIISFIFNCLVRAEHRCIDLPHSRKRAAHLVGRAAWTSPLPVPHVIQDCTRAWPARIHPAVSAGTLTRTAAMKCDLRPSLFGLPLGI